MAQIYQRIANPYMPNGTPDKTNAPSPYYAPGELGCAFTDQNDTGSYLRVQLDSGATASTPVGAVVAGQVAYWKNRSTATVTNDKRFCDVGASGAINRVAGFFQLAVSTAPGVNGSDGNPLLYMTDLVIQKRGFVAQATGTIVAGGQMLVDTTANTARLICPAAVNTAPVSQVVGISTTAVLSGSNTTPVDVNIGFGNN